MAINIRRGFHRVSLLIQILYALGCAGVFIGEWNNAVDNKYVADPNLTAQLNSGARAATPNPFDQFYAPASAIPAAQPQPGPWDNYAAPDEPAAPSDLSQMSDADLMAAYKKSQQAPPAPPSFDNSAVSDDELMARVQSAHSKAAQSQLPPNKANPAPAANVPKLATNAAVDYDPPPVSKWVWAARKKAAINATIALLVGLFCWRLFAFTIGWLWDGFAKQSDVM